MFRFPTLSARRSAGRALAIVTATVAVTVGVSACSATPEDAPEPTEAPAAQESPATSTAADEILAAHGLEGLTTREVIDTLDATPLDERADDLMASIRPDALLLTSADGTEASLPMPEDAFYVSIAPYVETTHDCYFHSLTTCTGELGGEELDVVVTDLATGEVLVDEALTAQPNGFVGLWLPRDLEVDVQIQRDGLAASTTLSTADVEDATCVTTMQLA